MGDIADAMINGDMDSLTGEWLGNGGGYPRTRQKDCGVHYYEPGPTKLKSVKLNLRKQVLKGLSDRGVQFTPQLKQKLKKHFMMFLYGKYNHYHMNKSWNKLGKKLINNPSRMKAFAEYLINLEEDVSKQC